MSSTFLKCFVYEMSFHKRNITKELEEKKSTPWKALFSDHDE